VITRRAFGQLLTESTGTAAALVAAASLDEVAFGQSDTGSAAAGTSSPVPTKEGDVLRFEFLLDLTIERGTPNSVGSPGSNRVVVPVAGGTFEGPKLKGKIVNPSGDWIVARPDGSSLLDLRAVLQTTDGQNIYMTSRGIAYAQPG